MRKRFISLPVLVVLLATGFVYYTTVFIVTEQWLSLSSASGLLNAIIFTGLTLMSLVCYTLAIVKDPGQVPPSYMRDLEDPNVSMHEVKRKGGDLRYCQKCGHYKPPRAHHCRVCKRCVLRMDHHCVWINNCVGHENYKAFFLFVLYVVIACIYALVLLVGFAVEELREDEHQSGNIFKTYYIVCASILIPLTLALVVLLVWHMYLLSHNKTTIEYHEGVRAMWLDEKAGRVYRHPYDLGLYTNLVSVLGPNQAKWICPTALGYIGSGLRFPTYHDNISCGQLGSVK
uniref:S-acyltransferase n=1 Tax=Araucaria cunninghamii TaxID=56994 RepID=A0A0D6R576_ARACU